MYDKPKGEELETPTREAIDLDAIILANSAEVQNGLAYVLGGAWTRCWPPEGTDYPYERSVSIVFVIRIPWADTNVLHRFRVRFLDSDNREVCPAAEGAFKAGRQADLTDGASQAVVASIVPTLKLASPGLYYVAVDVDEVERKRVQFEAIAPPGTRPER